MKIKQAFTLIELIVVITILAILGTIGFISLQGFSSDARDSKRISELTEIRSGLQIYQARNSLLPTPSEQSVTIGSGATNLIIQGYTGESVLNEIRMNGNPKDPLDNKYYTYSVNANKTKFQLLALLENDNNLTSFNNLNIISTTHASYTNRYLYAIGQNIGILLDETKNIPIQELVTLVDLNTDTNNYKVVFANNNEVLTLSGELLYQEIVNQTNNNGIDQIEETVSEPEELEPNYSCTTQPSYTNANFTVGTPSQENQIWQNTNNTEACYYECTNGYTGNECDTLIVGQNMSTLSGQEVFYAGVYQGRTLWVAGTENTGLQWKTSNTSTSNASDYINGSQNTGTNNSTHPASNYCQNLDWAGYTDWYLPAMHPSSPTLTNCSNQSGELQFLYCQHKGTGSQSLLGFASYGYWSSNNGSTNNALVLFFIDASYGNLYKSNTYRIRCVRQAD